MAVRILTRGGGGNHVVGTPDSTTSDHPPTTLLFPLPLPLFSLPAMPSITIEHKEFFSPLPPKIRSKTTLLLISPWVSPGYTQKQSFGSNSLDSQRSCLIQNRLSSRGPTLGKGELGTHHSCPNRSSISPPSLGSKSTNILTPPMAPFLPLPDADT
jgi:hypothetical protein